MAVSMMETITEMLNFPGGSAMADFTPSPADDPVSRSSNPLKWIALGCGGCFVLSVLLVGVLTVLVSRTMRFAIGPEGVSDSNDLFTYSLPGESQGIVDMGMFGMQITQVSSTNTPPSVLLTMGKIPGYLQNPRDRTTFLESFQEGMIASEGYELSAPSSEERQLCEQSVAVVVQTGQYQLEAATYDVTSLLAIVDYDSTTRFVWILAHGNEAPANADQVFESLDCL